MCGDRQAVAFLFASASLPYLMLVSHACLWWDLIMSGKCDKRRHTSVQGTLLADPRGGWGFLIKGPGRAWGVRPGPKQECNWVPAPHPKAAASADWRCNARILVVHLAGRERRLDRWTLLRVASTSTKNRCIVTVCVRLLSNDRMDVHFRAREAGVFGATDFVLLALCMFLAEHGDCQWLQPKTHRD